jgi:hypothetical protein
MAATRAPSARIVGLDVDPDILSIARARSRAPAPP